MTVAAVPGNLAEVLRHVRQAAGDRVGGALLDLIVEEVFLNIAHHACPGEAVEVLCRATEAAVELEFQYPGPEFDPTVAPPPSDLDAPLGQRRIGGLGVWLIRQLAGSVLYKRENYVNCLTLLIN